MSSHRSAGDRDPTGLFFVPPVEKGIFNDQGCCGPVGIGIVVAIVGLWWGLANAHSPIAIITVVVLLVVVVSVVKVLSNRD